MCSWCSKNRRLEHLHWRKYLGQRWHFCHELYWLDESDWFFPMLSVQNVLMLNWKLKMKIDLKNTVGDDTEGHCSHRKHDCCWSIAPKYYILWLYICSQEYFDLQIWVTATDFSTDSFIVIFNIKIHTIISKGLTASKKFVSFWVTTSQSLLMFMYKKCSLNWYWHLRHPLWL